MRSKRARYHGVKVLDVHGHVSAPPAGQGYLMLMMASNTAAPSPPAAAPVGRRPGMSDEDFHRTAAEPARYMDERSIICHCGGALNRFIPTDPHLAQKDLRNNLVYDSRGYDLLFLEAAIKQRGVDSILFGTEAPGSGRAVRPETGRTCDDLVPVIAAFDFLSENDKLKIFHENPAKVFPKLAKI